MLDNKTLNFLILIIRLIKTYLPLMKSLILVLSLLITNFSLAQNSLSYLDSAYQNNSIEQLDKFFQHWYFKSQPNTPKDSLEKDVYDISKDFYNPFNLKRIGKGEFGEDLYSGIHYVIIQNSLIVIRYNDEDMISPSQRNYEKYIFSKDTIRNFQPGVYFDDVKTLFLTPEYDSIINNFLYYNLDSKDSIEIVEIYKSVENKLNFLNNRIVIFPGHWGYYFHINTRPEITDIHFNKSRTKALINFRLIYQGGITIYKKLNGKWIFEKSRITWIE